MHEVNKHSILLGGIGGDSHSVGLSILRQALFANGYRIFYLGIQNHIEEFFRLAALSNAVLISSMDGHAKRYLQNFAKFRFQRSSPGVLWYLGGNLSVEDTIGCESYFLDLGFDRVFSKYVDIETVLSYLNQDFSKIEPVVNCDTLWEQLCPKSPLLSKVVSDELLSLDHFKKIRPDVLEHWKTGYQARDIANNADFLLKQPSFPKVQASVNSHHRKILIQPRSGVALVDEQIKLFKAFKRAGASVLSYQVDSLTRNNNYEGAQEAIRESYLSQQSSINGFPIVNHGVKELRRIISEVALPLQARHSTRDPRLLAEISYAGGVTAYEGGGLSVIIYPIIGIFH